MVSLIMHHLQGQRTRGAGTPAFRELLERTGTVYMVGNWTNVDSVIGAFLQHYHSPGVPLYVVFPKGDGAGKVLPSVLTLSLVRQALSVQADRNT